MQTTHFPKFPASVDHALPSVFKPAFLLLVWALGGVVTIAKDFSVTARALAAVVLVATADTSPVPLAVVIPVAS